MKKWMGLVLSIVMGQVAAEEGVFRLPRVEVTLVPNHEVVLEVAGRLQTAWHHGLDHPRPFFYPFNGPAGVSLTRMGHPGAPDHDHHASVWFAHADVDGVNFWGNSSGAVIRQKQWLAYQEGDEEGVMAVRLGWFAAGGEEMLEQEVVAALRPLADGEQELEIQCTLRPAAGKPQVVLGKTAFGLLAVRVAKSLSEHFGGGKLTSSDGVEGEPAIFGKPARWMDYSGPIGVGEGAARQMVTEGITFFDHSENPRHPTTWHVRADGWMGASFCREDSWTIPAEKPLRLRYLLHAHAGGYDAARAEARFAAFQARPPLAVQKAERHRHFEVVREGESSSK
jgi:hypothetical protein